MIIHFYTFNDHIFFIINPLEGREGGGLKLDAL